jgi:hypothetical protein
MKDYKQLLKQLPSKTLVCAFGEFNPPTVAHELLIKTVKVLAEKKNSDHVIFTVPSKNTLIQEDKKEQYLKLMFPTAKFSSFSGFSEKYNKIIVVTGPENFSELKKLKESYNIEIVSITDTTTESSTKMKQFATKGIYEQFKKNLPSTIRDIDGRRMMNEIRASLGLEPVKEQINLVKDQLREQYFKGEIFNEGDLVESNDVQYTIVKRGSNHLLLKDSEGSLVSKWIHDVKISEGVIQPNGTDQILAATNSQVDKDQTVEKPKGKIKGFITFYNNDKQNEEVENIQEVSSDLVKKARDAAFAKGKDDQGHRFVKKAYEKGQKESDAMAKKLSEDSGFCPECNQDPCACGGNHIEEAKKVCKQCGKSPCECESHGVDRTAINPTFDPFFKEEHIDEMIESLTDDEILEEYEEDEFIIIDEETGEELPAVDGEEKIDLMEVLSRQERLRQKLRLRKTAAKRARSTKISMKRFSPPATINKRARRLAIKLMKKRMLRGRDPSKISVSEKEQIEKRIAGNKSTVNRVAAKLVTRIRKVEKARMSGGKAQKGAMPSVF